MDDFSSPFQFFTNRRTIQWLLVPVVLLPVGMIFLFTFGRFFAMLHDTVSAAVLDWIALALGFFWFLSLVFLLLVIVQIHLNQTDDIE